MAIRITALGTLRVEQDGRVLRRLPVQRVRSALLVYLAMEREATRDALMGLLWPERPSDRARHLLNQTLYELRQDLGDAWVESMGDRLVATDQLRIDAGEFTQAVESGDFDSALRRYGGPFLDAISLGVSRPMESWIDAQEARLGRLHRRARRGAIETRVDLGDLSGSLQLARTWAGMHPLDDEAQHRLIELLAATGDRSGALSQYERYAALVESELELEPLDETREMVERIRQGEVGSRAAPGVSAGAPIAPTPDGPGTGAAGAGPDGPPAEQSRTRAVPRAGSRRGPVALLLLLVAALAVAVGVLVRRDPGPTQGTRLATLIPDNALNPRRIAVLYFNDFSENQDLSYLAAGFTEMLIDELSQVEELDVISRTAVSHYRDMQGNVMDSLRTHLAPGTVVEGSLIPLGDRIQVRVQLIDGATAGHLMSRTLTGPADSASLLLDPLAEQAARMLRQRLGTEIELTEARRQTDVPEAWDLVQRARQLMADAMAIRRRDKEAGLAWLSQADSLLVRAQELDPDWPEPRLRRAITAMNRSYILSPVPSQYDSAAAARGLAHLDTVLERWPDHAKALAQRGIYTFEIAESGAEDPYPLYDAAESDLRRAIILDGDHSEAWWGLSRLLYRRGDYAEAERAAERALRTDMFLAESRPNLWHLFQVSLNLEDFDQAARWCDEIRTRHPKAQHVAYCEILLLVASPEVQPDVDRAWALSRRITETAPRSDTAVYRRYSELYVARVLARAGLPDSARAVLARTVPGELPGWAAYDVAHTRLMLGDVEGALEALRTYVDTYPGRAQSLDDDWWLRRLHGDPRFQELLGIGPG